MGSNPLVAWLERHQVILYVVAIAGGAVAGGFTPGSQRVEAAINPAIALLLLATFLAVPFASIGQALKDVRFLVALVLLNFVLVPIVVFALSRFVAHDQALLIGVLLVLLTPCVDYVMVFSALAGAAHERLLAAAPLLMLLRSSCCRPTSSSWWAATWPTS